MRPPRGLLFVPGDRPERFDKARASGADAVVIDLEDAVAPDHKPAARDALADWLDNRPDRAPPARWLLRLNGTDTRWFDDDARLAAHPALSAVMLPKAAHADEVAALGARCGGKPVLPLVETAAGVAAARALAAAPGVAQLVFGTVDLQLDLDLDEADAPDVLLPHAAALVLASRLAQLPGPVDGVSLVLDDPERLAAQSRRARALGFAGKLCIHPRQVAPVQAAWTPTPAQRDWARRVLEAAAQAAGGAFSVDGRMVDAPVLARARRLLEEGEEGGPR